MSVQLRVIVEEHDIRKINLPSGIPNSIKNLISIITDTFQLNGEFALLYEDKDFGNQFFSVISSADLYDKATVKLVRKEPLITLNMLPVESGLSSAQVLCTNSVDIFPGDTSEAEPIPVDDSEADTSLASTSSQGSSMFPESCRSVPWPVSFQVPQFSRDVELILAEANKIHHDSGIHFSDASVEWAIMQDLAKAIFSYTAYPSTLQISSVADALVEKFPCLKEPGSFSGMYGWQQRLKYKMHNYRAKLKSRKYAFPEIEVNTLKRKQAVDAAPAKNVKRPKKAEMRYWASVEGSLPAWEQFLLGKGPLPAPGPGHLPRRAKQRASTATDQGLPPAPNTGLLVEREVSSVVT
ncbi:hypothetical protein KUCAC02_030737 [Chaenocephalus aceratus]|uniref:Uncharacterized protein n=1 Tax=Chaenocephalus aceratus TaxID=36190 RepID=A0ACB9XJM4_CHAAC|nr:hypothetical protein KUCAC02_030737 [Chaenocephalus aceratus]